MQQIFGVTLQNTFNESCLMAELEPKLERDAAPQQMDIIDCYLELPKPLKRSVHFESTGFYVLFIKTTVPLQKPRLFPINSHFVCPLALRSV